MKLLRSIPIAFALSALSISALLILVLYGGVYLTKSNAPTLSDNQTLIFYDEQGVAHSVKVAAMANNPEGGLTPVWLITTYDHGKKDSAMGMHPAGSCKTIWVIMEVE